MFKITTPKDYISTPWKNGKGETIELAISESGSIDHFDWRISIATVTEDGVFSDFSGLRRDLFLIEGEGIKLTHNNTEIDLLTEHLAVATFDGGATTLGELVNGTIKDLNLMTKQGKYQVNTFAFNEQGVYELPDSGLCFVYSHKQDVYLVNEYHDEKRSLLPQGHLLSAENGLSGLCVDGADVLVIQLLAE